MRSYLYVSFFVMAATAAPEFLREAFLQSSEDKSNNDFTSPGSFDDSSILNPSRSRKNYQIAGALKGDSIPSVLDRGSSENIPIFPCLKSDPACGHRDDENVNLPPGVSCNEQYDDCVYYEPETDTLEVLHWEGCRDEKAPTKFTKPNPTSPTELSVGCRICFDQSLGQLDLALGNEHCGTVLGEGVSIRHAFIVPKLDILDPR